MRRTLQCVFLLSQLVLYSAVKAQCTVKLAGESCAGRTVLAYMPATDISALTWYYEGVPVFEQPAPFGQDGRKIIAGNGINGITGVVSEGTAIYVNDWYNHRILKFSPGSPVGQVVATAKEGNYDIYDFCVYRDTVYLAENYYIRYPGDTPYYITKWIPGAVRGVAVAGMGTPIRLFREVKTIAIDKAGMLYSGDIHGSGLGRVIRFRPGGSSQNLLVGGFITSNTTLRKNFDDLQVDDDGAVYLLFRDSGYIKKWEPGNSEGNIVARLIPVAPDNSYYSRTSFFVAKDKTIYCTENNDPGPFGRIIGSQRVVRFDSGSVTGTVLLGDDGRHFSSVSGIAVDKNGNLLVGDFELNTVQHFVPSTKMFTRYTPTAAGNYAVTVSGSNGCSTTHYFTVDPQTVQPYINGPRYVCPGDKGVTFSIANPQPSTIYKWYIEPHAGTIVSGQGSMSVKIDWGAAYYGFIKVTAYTRCGPSPQANALVSCLEYARKQQENVAGLRINPNPVTGQANISWNATVPGTFIIQVRDVLGNVFVNRKGKSVAAGRESVVMDLSILHKGVYLLNIITPSGTSLPVQFIRQ